MAAHRTATESKTKKTNEKTSSQQWNKYNANDDTGEHEPTDTTA